MTPDYWSNATRDATIERGLAIYNTDLKAILEPVFAGQVVTIHIETGDYAVGRNSSLASRVLRARQPQGLTVSLDIGDVPVNDPQSQRMRGESHLH